METISTLSDLVEITSGYPFREGVKVMAGADTPVLQMRNLDRSTLSVELPEPAIVSYAIPIKFFVRPGDLLFLGKGMTNFAVVYRHNQPAVPSSVFYILRLRDKKIDPDYLALYLNTGEGLRQLNQAKAGTTVTNITTDSLARLVIRYPPLQQQIKLVNLYKLWLVEKEQTLKLIAMKEQFFNNITRLEILTRLETEQDYDDAAYWRGYERAALYYMAKIKFKDSIFIKRMDKPTKELVAIIIDMVTHQKKVGMGPGSSREYVAVKEWKLILPIDLRMNNDPAVSKEKKESEIINTIPHSLIDSITMIDRRGNEVQSNLWN